MSGQIYIENQRGALNQSTVIFLITDIPNGNIFQEKTHYHLVSAVLTAEISRTNRVFVFPAQKGHTQLISLRISIPAEGGLLGCTGDLWRLQRLIPLFFFLEGLVRGQQHLPKHFIIHRHTRNCQTIWPKTKKCLQVCWHICTIFPALPLCCFGQIPPALSRVTFLSLKWETSPILFPNS